MLGGVIYLAALALFLGLAAYFALRNREPARPRLKPFDDPGGYRAHGDWPFVPSDLKAFHNGRGINP